MKHYFTSIDLQNADTYASNRTKELKYYMYVKLYPHIFSHTTGKFDNDNAEVKFTKYGCENISCYDKFPRSRTCNRTSKCEWYSSGDTMFLRCQPSCYNFYTKHDTALNPFDVEYIDNRCVIHNTALQSYMTDPSTRVEKFTKGISTLQTGLDYDRKTGRGKINKYFCNHFRFGFDPRSDNCVDTTGQKVSEFLFGSTFTYVFNPTSKLIYPNPILLKQKQIPDSYKTVDNWLNQRSADYETLLAIADKKIQEFRSAPTNNVTLNHEDDVARNYYYGELRTKRQDVVDPTKLTTNHSEIHHYIDYFLDLCNDSFVLGLLVQISFDLNVQIIKKQLVNKLPVFVKSIGDIVLDFLANKSAIAVQFAAMLTTLKVFNPDISMKDFARVGGLAIDSIMGVVDALGIAGIILDQLDPLGLKNKYDQKHFDDVRDRYRFQFHSMDYQNNLEITPDVVWRVIEKRCPLPDDYHNALVICHFKCSHEYLNNLEFNSVGQKLDHSVDKRTSYFRAISPSVIPDLNRNLEMALNLMSSDDGDRNTIPNKLDTLYKNNLLYAVSDKYKFILISITTLILLVLALTYLTEIKSILIALLIVIVISFKFLFDNWLSILIGTADNNNIESSNEKKIN